MFILAFLKRSVVLCFLLSHHKNTNSNVPAALQLRVGRLQAQISGAPRRPATATAATARRWRWSTWRWTAPRRTKDRTRRHRRRPRCRLHPKERVPLCPRPRRPSSTKGQRHCDTVISSPHAVCVSFNGEMRLLSPAHIIMSMLNDSWVLAVELRSVWERNTKSVCVSAQTASWTEDLSSARSNRTCMNFQPNTPYRVENTSPIHFGCYVTQRALPHLESAWNSAG